MICFRIMSVVSVMRRAESDPEMAKCFHPKSLRGVGLLELGDDAVSCHEAEEYVTGNGKSRLECTATGKLNIQWLYRGKELEYSSLKTYEILSNKSLLIDNSEITTNFQCAADYHVVPIRNRRQLHFNSDGGEPPRFILKPKDAAYREGSVVKLNCEVSGNPKPSIEWKHNGIRLQSTREHELSFDGTVLSVYPFIESRAGRYTCSASNVHGFIEHTAHVELIASNPPVIFDAPESKTVDVGQQVTFRCKARGVPKPEYTWSFDGSIIPHIRGRMMVSDDGSELRISNVERQDDGIYSCMAGNSVGAMSADARLTVRGTDQSNQIDDILTEDTLRKIATQAKANVDRAVENTRLQLSQQSVNNTKDLKKLFRFTLPSQAVELSKAREIYEESVRLVHEHVAKGLRLNVAELAPNVSYESVLHVTHMNTLMGLSGCAGGQFKNPCTDTCYHNRYRSFDGQCNNHANAMWGVSQMPFLRLIPPIYENGFNTPVGWEKGRLYNGHTIPNARDISHQLIGTREITPHPRLSAMVMQWGQFLDHDMTHTAQALSRHSYATGAFCNRTCENLDPCFNIPLPPGDPRRNIDIHMKYPCIEFERSAAVCGSGETSLIFQRVTYRDQMNIITSFIDASNVYGSREVQAQELRELYSDRGLLRFDTLSNARKPYLPFEKDSNMDCRRNVSEENPIRCFLAGDFRANEQLGLTSMHTLFMREHNRIAERLYEMNPKADGEVIYHETRKILGAVMQHITYTQWLPKIMGKKAFGRLIGSTYRGYDHSLNPSVTNAFATAAFRFGHTLINPILMRLDADFQTIPQGHLPLHQAFFTTERLMNEGGIDPLLRGLFASPLKAPKSNQLLNMELTEKLFHKFHEVALDLAVMNIQRSRDHGLPSYTAYRKFCNLTIPRTWDDLRSQIPDAQIREKLRSLYGHPGKCLFSPFTLFQSFRIGGENYNIDLWVGGIIEEKMEDALIGETFGCIIADQFKRLREGDRFWYEKEGVFTDAQLREIKKVTLPRILCDNGDGIDRVQRDIFMYPGPNKNDYDSCSAHESMDLRAWSNCCKEDRVCQTMLDNTLRSRHRGSKLHGCKVEGSWRPEGYEWSPAGDFCTECICQNTRIWCSVKEECDETRGNTVVGK
ncbi:hypothetical protein WR25_18023 [Diploscapter pachys]|uniref:Ig-like domain-containing protein n=1 Tax=Diploscapter pachys TaxID=2018661 RepID=A0A2A2KMN6_9BILA|nr:hypothetical protein WR25_18023 [Diploscapter pachys]